MRPDPPARRGGGSVERRRRGWAAASLRWRLAGWVVLVVLLSTGIAFFAVYRGTGTQLRRQIDQEIAGDADELESALVSTHLRTPRQALATARSYVRGQPFDASSTVLFALVPRAGIATNTPELFGSPGPDDGESAVVQESENRLSQRLLTAPLGYSTLDLPDVGDMRVVKRTVPLPAEGFVAGGKSGASGESSTGSGSGAVRQVTIGVGETLANVAHAQRGVARAFVLAGLLTLAGALIASLLIGTRFSRPLRRMAGVAALIDAGDLHPRIQDVHREGAEVRVLADAFNRMLDRLTDAFAGQRAFVADASHELRTPLTVIRGQLEVLAAQEEPAPAEVRRVERLVQAEITRITRLVDDLLLLAKAEQTNFLRLEPLDLPAFLEDLWEGVVPLAPRRFELAPPPSGTLVADPDRLAQALRNLLANAIAHTGGGGRGSGLVHLEVERPGELGPGWVRFVVRDDGPGISPEQRERVFDRFHRTDAARDRASGGTGLGLAIVRAIAEAHGGRVAATAAEGGGARMELDLPRFTPGERTDKGRAVFPMAKHA
ncbi:MAG TPA: HAMP domain-containing sensor histidine kinase [Solirubrobacteraceae bacterium]|jgi:two-component system OmpR family sensor kinase|nr:HAMP domain-containing sensor histidine kinase [Solirubrobacteraceae bacterium]